MPTLFPEPIDRTTLILSNRPLAHWVARRFANRGIDLDDLRQTAELALVRAVDGFDPTRNVKFSTYATWTIIRDLQQAVDTSVTLVHYPHALAPLVRKVRAWQQAHPGRTLADYLAAFPLRRKARAILVDAVTHDRPRIFHTAHCRARLDYPTRADREATEAVHDGDEAEWRLAQLHDPREAMVIRRLFGFGCVPCDAKSLGKQLGMSANGVRYIRDQALDHMRCVGLVGARVG